jgi:ABC-2 type transport system permease protein
MNTIYILWIRQLKRFIRSRARIASSLGQPLLFLLAFGFGFGPIFAKAGGGDYLQFLGPGIIAMGIVFTAIFSGTELIWDRQFGFLKETLVAPVPRWQIMFGRTLGGATVATLQGLLVLILAIAVGFRPLSFPLLLLSIVFMFLTALLFTATGTAIASLMEDMQSFPVIMNFFIMPVFFLSGALFPLNGLPEAFTVIATVNPLSYGVDALRATLAGAAHFGLATDVGVLAITALLVIGIGSWLFSRIEV